MGEFVAVGKSVPRLDAVEKVTGKGKFVADIDLEFPGLLYAKVLRSPYPHAKILKIDTREAKKLQGVKGVFTAADFPRKLRGLGILDEPIVFAIDKVRYVGEAVAAVVATDFHIARDALDLIKVDYKELPAVFDPEEAMKPSPPAIIHEDLFKYDIVPALTPVFDKNRPNVYNHRKLRLGDVEKGFKDADVIVENRYTTATASHCQLEPHNAIAKVESDGSLSVWSSTQGAFVVKGHIASSLGIPPSKVRVRPLYVGGGFGGKLSPRADIMAAALAWKLGKPVRVMFSRSEVFTSAIVRHAFVIYAKHGARKDGKLTAAEVTAIMNGGAYADWGWLTTRNTVYTFGGFYDIPNIKFDAYGVYTNLPVAAAFRGFGNAQLHFAIESQIDILAEKLGIDPAEMRRINFLKDGGENALRERVFSFGAPECLERVVEAIGWGKRPKREDRGVWKRGLGFALGCKYSNAPHMGCATVRVREDETVEVRMSADEMGQGIRTGIAQLAAEEFKVPLEKIVMVPLDTDITPYDQGSYSSRSLYVSGSAVVAACRDAKRQLFDMASKPLEAPPEELDTADGKIFVKKDPSRSVRITELFASNPFDRNRYLGEGGEIYGKATWIQPATPEDPETSRSTVPMGRVTSFYMHMAQAVEVEVNVETGQVRVLKHYFATDCGKAINPKLVESQADDGVQMGIGVTLYEQMLFSNGRVLNPNFTDYKMPTVMETPTLENVKVFIVEARHEDGPFGAKGTGEVTITATAPAIANAIYNAAGVRMKDTPITPERILEALKKKASKT